MNRIQELRTTGQSVWLDGMDRGMLDSGELAALANDGLAGVTTNPTLFERALKSSAAYDDSIRALAERGFSDEAIYDTILFEDITRAAEILRPLYDSTGGEDGFVSIEVSPRLAYDTEGTIAEARRLFDTLMLPNVMVKVPATAEGFPAVEELTAEGRNINITLMFSLQDYEDTVNAYMAGLERFAASGGDLRQVKSVASYFVSRIDVAVGKLLAGTIDEDLDGRIGIANSRLAYQRFREVLDTERWRRLATRKAHIQRMLWASTSVKEPLLPELLYAENLIGPDTVDTMPLETMRAFLDHGTVEERVQSELNEARRSMKRLSDAGVDMDVVTSRLEHEGVDAFVKSLDGLMDRIAEKRAELMAVHWAHV